MAWQPPAASVRIHPRTVEDSDPATVEPSLLLHLMQRSSRGAPAALLPRRSRGAPPAALPRRSSRGAPPAALIPRRSSRGAHPAALIPRRSSRGAPPALSLAVLTVPDALHRDP
eukprot:gene52597-59927_t